MIKALRFGCVISERRMNAKAIINGDGFREG